MKYKKLEKEREAREDISVFLKKTEKPMKDLKFQLQKLKEQVAKL